MKRVASSIFLGISILALVGCASTGATQGTARFVEAAIPQSSASSLSAIWARVAESAGLDSDKACLEDLTLQYSPTGAEIKLAISAATTDGHLVSASWSRVGQQAADTLNIGVDISAAVTLFSKPESPAIGPIFEALDQVGVDNMIAAIDEEGPVEYYTLHVLRGPSDFGPGIPSGYPAFIWDGGRFVSLGSADGRRAYGGSAVFVLVSPTVVVSPPSSVLAQETATTRMWQSLPSRFFVIPG